MATLTTAPRTDEAVENTNAYPNTTIHTMHGRREAKPTTTTTRSLVGGVPRIKFAGVINQELLLSLGNQEFYIAQVRWPSLLEALVRNYTKGNL